MDKALALKLGFAVAIILLVLLIIYYKFRNTAVSKNVFDALYFDNNGTTKPAAEVVKAMADAAFLGNASSSYANEAKSAIKLLHTLVHQHTNTTADTHEIVITSGASESNNQIIRSLVDRHALSVRSGAIQSPPHIVLSNVEHSTSIEAAENLARLGRCTVSFVAANPDGSVDADAVRRVITPSTILVSVMHANNELGTKNDLSQIGQLCRTRGIAFHTDAVQTFGKYPIDMTKWDIDALSMSFHKMHGPMGIGLLVVNKRLLDNYLAQITGSQNNHLRGGTENIPAIVGANRAMQITLDNRLIKNSSMMLKKQNIIKCLTNEFPVLNYREFVGKPDKWIPNGLLKGGTAIVFMGPTTGNGLPVETMGIASQQQSVLTGVLPNTLMFSVVKIPSTIIDQFENYKHFCNIKLKSALAENSAYVSIGSACQTSSPSPSHVLLAINAPFVIRCGVIRVSLSDYTTNEQVDQLCKLLTKLIRDQ